MTKTEAIKVRDENKNLICKPFDGSKSGWDIKDLIVASKHNVCDIYNKMWLANIDNELALSSHSIGEDDYDVFVISHQWSWGSGDLLFERLESYKKFNPF